MADTNTRKLYFTAGPAKIPDEVMRQIRNELLDFNNMGISVMEMSHRSKEYDALHNETEANFRKLLKVPDNYSILFMHGGAKTQFDSVPMNLCSELDKSKVDYLINGSWSKMAAKEATKYAKDVVRQTFEGPFTRQLSKDELVEHQDAAYRYYCDNETIEGVEWNYVPESSAPLVCDMTSNFLSRPVEIKKFGVVFAGAQKNCGLAGLCIVIVRKDLIGKHMRIVPKLQNYQDADANRSLSNTPQTFAIYAANLCAKLYMKMGGLEAIDEMSRKKSAILYDLIDNSGGFYTNPVERSSRSRMNVVFLLSNKDLESKFLQEAEKANLFDLKGHRSVGGFRASIYNGITIEDVQRLASFMNKFRQSNST